MARQQQGKRVGLNISQDHKAIYKEIETTIYRKKLTSRDGELKLKRIRSKWYHLWGRVHAKCSRGLSKNKYGHTHEGDRWLPIRQFAIMSGADTKLQSACRDCDHKYRVEGRAAENSAKFEGKSETEIRAMYTSDYPDANGLKKCSRAYSGGCLGGNNCNKSTPRW